MVLLTSVAKAVNLGTHTKEWALGVISGRQDSEGAGIKGKGRGGGWHYRWRGVGGHTGCATHCTNVLMKGVPQSWKVRAESVGAKASTAKHQVAWLGQA